jgi:hypothetical protein
MWGAAQRGRRLVRRPAGMVDRWSGGWAEMRSECLVGNGNNEGSVTMEEAYMACEAEPASCRPPRRPLFDLDVIGIRGRKTLVQSFPVGRVALVGAVGAVVRGIADAGGASRRWAGGCHWGVRRDRRGDTLQIACEGQ